MHKLLYVSSTRRDFPIDGLNAILPTARRKNAMLGVTGLLLYIDGGFLQVLEGQRDILHDLYGVIASDNRHWNANLLLDQDGPRNFGNWDMGFRVLGQMQPDVGLVELTQSALKGLIKPGSAKPVLDILINTF